MLADGGVDRDRAEGCVSDKRGAKEPRSGDAAPPERKGLPEDRVKSPSRRRTGSDKYWQTVVPDALQVLPEGLQSSPGGRPGKQAWCDPVSQMEN